MEGGRVDGSMYKSARREGTYPCSTLSMRRALRNTLPKRVRARGVRTFPFAPKPVPRHNVDDQLHGR